MFDRGLISLSDELDILVSRQVNDPDSVWSLVNKSRRALAPARAMDRPHPHFLAWHREWCFKLQGWRRSWTPDQVRGDETGRRGAGVNPAPSVLAAQAGRAGATLA
jgi:hypothetical protein